jgi:hypothetical protein
MVALSLWLPSLTVTSMLKAVPGAGSVGGTT